MQKQNNKAAVCQTLAWKTKQNSQNTTLHVKPMPSFLQEGWGLMCDRIQGTH